MNNFDHHVLAANNSLTQSGHQITSIHLDKQKVVQMKNVVIVALVLSGISFTYEYKQLNDMRRYGKATSDSSILYYRINHESTSDPYPTFNISTVADGKLNVMIGDLDCENTSSWLKVSIIMNQDKVESMNNVSATTKFEKFQEAGIFGKMCRDIETTNSVGR